MKLVPDGAGGAYAFWVDARDGSANVFAQRLNSLGAPLWAEDVAVSTSGNLMNSDLAAVSDGSGGAIVLWTVGAIYGQRIGPDGDVAWTAGGALLMWAPLAILRFPKAVGDGAGGIVIGAREGMGADEGSKLRVQRVGSDGLGKWGTGGVLVTDELSDSEYFDFALAADGANGAIFAWTRQSGFTFDGVYAQRVSGGALAWGAGGVIVAQEIGAQFGIDVVADGAGGAWFAWSDARMGTADLFAQRLDANGTPTLNANGVPLVVLPGNQEGARAVTDGAGGMIVAYRDDARGDGHSDLFAQRIQPDGTLPWGAGGVEVASLPDHQTLENVVAEAGGVIVVWKDFRSLTSYDLYAQRINAGGAAVWPAGGLPISAGGYDQADADAALVGGGLLIAWTDFRAHPHADIFAQLVNAAGERLPEYPSVVPKEPWHAFNAPFRTPSAFDFQAISVPAGGAYVGFRRAPGMDLTLQRLDDQGEALWAPEGLRVAGPGGDFQIVGDGVGGVIIAWASGGDVFAQRVNSDAEPLWGSAGTAVCQAADSQSEPQVVSDGAGGAVVVWNDTRTGFTTFMDLYAQRLDASGAPQWAADGVVVSATVWVESGARVLGDGAGGVYVLWSDERNQATTGEDVFAQRLDGTGAPQWGAALAVAAAAGVQNFIHVVSDGAGGFIASWSDTRSGLAIYAQRVNPAGAPQWSLNGAPVCLLGSGAVEMVSDGFGGAILSWTEYRSGSQLTVYAQRVSPAGATLWPAEGVPLSVRPVESARHAMLPDGAGGAFVAWSDASNWDLYLQRVDASGSLTLAGGGTPISTARYEQRRPLLAALDASHLIAFWWDARRGSSSTSSVYFQRLGLDGVP